MDIGSAVYDVSLQFKDLNVDDAVKKIIELIKQKKAGKPPFFLCVFRPGIAAVKGIFEIFQELFRFVDADFFTAFSDDVLAFE